MAETPTRWEATGRRKESAARVRLQAGTGRIMINGREEQEFLRRPILGAIIRMPFQVTGTDNQFDVHCTVKGGGLTGVAGAIRHGISRALCVYNEDLRGPLKRAGYLTRDPRAKERKKYGMKGARARYQFSKR